MSDSGLGSTEAQKMARGTMCSLQGGDRQGWCALRTEGLLGGRGKCERMWCMSGRQGLSRPSHHLQQEGPPPSPSPPKVTGHSPATTVLSTGGLDTRCTPLAAGVPDEGFVFSKQRCKDASSVFLGTTQFVTF